MNRFNHSADELCMTAPVFLLATTLALLACPAFGQTCLTCDTGLATLDTALKIDAGENQPQPFRLFRTGSAAVLMRFQNTDQSWRVGMNGSETFMVFDGNTSETPFAIEAGAPTGSIYVDATGQVGLGTDEPSRDLDVAGSAVISGSGTGTAILEIAERAQQDPILTFSIPTEDWAIGIDNSDGDSFKFQRGTGVGSPSVLAFSADTVPEIEFGSGVLDIAQFKLNLITEELTILDAGSVGATELGWIEVKIGSTTGYIRMFSSK